MASKRTGETDSERDVSKRRKVLRGKEICRERVYIKGEYLQWCAVKDLHRLATHEDTAKYLLDCYEKYQKLMTKASTPYGPVRPPLPSPPGVSSVSSAGEGDSVFTDIMPLSSSSSGMSGKERTLTAEPSALHMSMTLSADEQPSESNLHFSTTLTAEEQPSELAHVEESTSQTSDNEDRYGLALAVQTYKEDISFEPEEPIGSELSDSEGSEYTTQESESDIDDLEISTLDAEVFDIVTPDEELVVGEKHNTPRGSTLADADIIAKQCTIAYEENLLHLARHAPRGHCQVKGCKLPFSVTNRMVGTALYLTWACPKKHVGYTWCSQPRLKVSGVHAGDFCMSMNILLSGNNYTKVTLLCRYMHLGIPHATLFQRIQSLYCCPVIDQYWTDQLSSLHQSLRDKPLILAGDGRNDSPGHSAQYLTYTLMEHETKKIVAIQVVDKREVALKSPNMEKEGLRKALQQLTDAGIEIKELVTDAHSQISSMMKKDYPAITHSWDVWHGAKNLTKRLTAAAAEEKDLAPWVKDISNHFWYCAEHADGSVDNFKATWCGVLHHVVNKHEWILGHGGGEGKCAHGPLDNERRNWLEPESDSHIRLRKVVFDTRLMNTFHHYTNFRHTGELETFHNHLLMYAAKRYAFRVKRRYSKRTKTWSVVQVKEAKTYSYIPSLQRKIIQACLEDIQRLDRGKVVSQDDPRLIAPTSAEVPPPPTAEIQQVQKSRFRSKDKL